MTKLHFISLGCPKNLVDSEVMLGHLVRDGFILTAEPDEAQVIVVNTCAFIEDAKKEAIDTVLEMGEHRKKGPCRLLVVAGCLPQRYEEELARLLPEVDVFIGAGEFPRIAEIIREWDGRPAMHVGRPTYIYDHEAPRIHTTPAHVGYLKIAEGCFHPCSFCIIPQLRGKFRSRPMESIVEEARGMLSRGVRELNVIAQDTTAYGRDIGLDLATLLRFLAGLSAPKWVRILYAYPHEFPQGVIEVMGEHPDICSYLDIPLQHISDRILKSMKRGGTGKEIRNFIGQLRSDIPGVALRTSLITGYPGETPEEHDELLDFVCETRFEHLGVFTYSPEEGTKAAGLKKRVPRDVAEGRRREIMDVQREMSLEINRRLVGKKIKVLVEGPSAESAYLLQARHQGQAPEVDGVIYINECALCDTTEPEGRHDVEVKHTGQFAVAEITDAHDYDLVGRIVQEVGRG